MSFRKEPSLHRQGACYSQVAGHDYPASYKLTPEQYNRLLTLCVEAIRYGGTKVQTLKDFLAGWGKIPALPMELHPPNIELTSEMFWLRLPSDTRPSGALLRLTASRGLDDSAWTFRTRKSRSLPLRSTASPPPRVRRWSPTWGSRRPPSAFAYPEASREGGRGDHAQH